MTIHHLKFACQCCPLSFSLIAVPCPRVPPFGQFGLFRVGHPLPVKDQPLHWQTIWNCFYDLKFEKEKVF